MRTRTPGVPLHDDKVFSLFWINPIYVIPRYWKVELIGTKPQYYRRYSLHRRHVLLCQSCYATNSECRHRNKAAVLPYTLYTHTDGGAEGHRVVTAFSCCGLAVRLLVPWGCTIVKYTVKKKARACVFWVLSLCFPPPRHYQFVVIATVASDTVISRPADKKQKASQWWLCFHEVSEGLW